MVAPSNKRMQLTKRGDLAGSIQVWFLFIGLRFAADPRCCADSWWGEVTGSRRSVPRWPYVVSACLASGLAWGLWRDEGATGWAAIYAIVAGVSVIQVFWSTTLGWGLVFASFVLYGGFVMVLLAADRAGPLEWFIVPWFALGPAVMLWSRRPWRAPSAQTARNETPA